ncbi:hypothetical protein Tco_1031507 [Tanacetum coccineum]|uniref:Uncharacterized protein n=1 Tax=Tanacetum coccineum TaxID=301880 RepID=A0ABQ5GAK0_9ASTR
MKEKGKNKEKQGTKLKVLVQKACRGEYESGLLNGLDQGVGYDVDLVVIQVMKSEPSRKAMNFRTLLTPAGNGVDVVVLMESIRAISDRFANTAYGFFLGKRVACPVVKLHGVPVTAFSEDGLSSIATKLGTPLMLDSYTSNMCIQSWGRSSYARALIKVRVDVELKDNIVVAMPKLDECPMNIDSDVVKNTKKPSRTPKGVPVSPKVGFKPVKQVFRQVTKKNNVNISGNKKKNVEPIIEVSNSNPFDVLNSVDNDVDLGTNGGTSNLASKKANSSGSSFWNVKSSSTSTTPIVEKFDKMEKLIIEWKITFVDDEGKPLTNVDSLGNHDSRDEVASVDNDMAIFLASKKDGHGTNSLLEQWKESYGNGDYDFDPDDDDMYEGQDIPDKIQDICDNLDIKFCGRKKKYLFLVKN